MKTPFDTRSDWTGGFTLFQPFHGLAIGVSRADYAYGSERAASGDLQTDRTFTGQKRDATGLLYYLGKGG